MSNPRFRRSGRFYGKAAAMIDQDGRDGFIIIANNLSLLKRTWFKATDSKLDVSLIQDASVIKARATKKKLTESVE